MVVVLTDEVGVEIADLGDGAFGSVVAFDGRTCKQNGKHTERKRTEGKRWNENVQRKGVQLL